jgi:uncharacterized protein YabE (DUF348 family)
LFGGDILRKSAFKKPSIYIFIFLILVGVSGLVFAAVSNSGKTEIKLKYGEESFSIKSSATTIEDALKEQGIWLYSKDKISIPQGTRLTGGKLEVVVTKSYPVLIFDGYQKIKGRAVVGTGEEMLKQNNITVYPEDKVVVSRVTNPAVDMMAGLEIRIDRAPTFNIYVDGTVKVVRSWDPLVSKILETSKVPVNRFDIISRGKNELLSPGEDIFITRVNVETVSETESIDFNTVHKGSTSISFGRSVITQTGAAGQKSNKFKITYKNGIMVSKVLLGSTVTKTPRSKIITGGIVVGKSNWGPYYENHNGPYTTAFYRKGYRGRYILITNLANGRQVKVQIVDYGPINGPLMDLSTTAFEALGGSTYHGHIDSVSVQLVE